MSIARASVFPPETSVTIRVHVGGDATFKLIQDLERLGLKRVHRHTSGGEYGTNAWEVRCVNTFDDAYERLVRDTLTELGIFIQETSDEQAVLAGRS